MPFYLFCYPWLTKPQKYARITKRPLLGNAMADAFKRKPEVEVSRLLIRNNKEKVLYVVVYPKLQKNPLIQIRSGTGECTK